MLERGKVVMVGTSNVLELKNTERSHSEGFHHVKSHKTINIKLSRENCFGKLALGHALFFRSVGSLCNKPCYWSHLSFDIEAKPSCVKSRFAFYGVCLTLWD